MWLRVFEQTTPALRATPPNSRGDMVFMTRVAVIGVGHLGKQHARLYAELGHLAGVVDIQEPRANEVAALYKTTAYIDYRELFGKVDAVSLAVPTTDHARIGVDLLALYIGPRDENHINFGI